MSFRQLANEANLILDAVRMPSEENTQSRTEAILFSGSAGLLLARNVMRLWLTHTWPEGQPNRTKEEQEKLYEHGLVDMDGKPTKEEK